MSRVQAEGLTGKEIHRAFREWDSLKQLGNHPLGKLGIVNHWQQAAGYTATNVGKGLALKEILKAALETLKPADTQPEPRNKSWRPYIILQERYLHGRNPDWVIEQLHVSRATYYAEHTRAMQMVADILQKWEEQQYFPPVIDGPVSAPPKNSPQAAPFMVPPKPVHTLVGRSALLDRLRQGLLTTSDTPHIALYGLPGVGKTSLITALAYNLEVRQWFKDGILWVGLGRQPDIPALLEIWGKAVDIPQGIITPYTTIADRASAIHAAIGSRRMLLIIDDAWNIDAALMFKVGGPNCVYLLTTRLASVALDFAGAGALLVQELSSEQGLALLTQLSPKVVETEPEEAGLLVNSVGGLPLALVLMGGYLRKQSHYGQSRRLHEAIDNLKQAQNRLQLAQTQSPLDMHPSFSNETSFSLRAAIGLNDAALSAEAHQALLDLALFPAKPNSFSEAAALAVLNAPSSLLDTLVDYGLLESVSPDRYTMHQTIADYALQQPQNPEAITRLAEYYIQFAESNANNYNALDFEQINWLNALQKTVVHQLHPLLVRGINRLFGYLETRGLYQIAQTYLDRACETALSGNDQLGLVIALNNAGELKVKEGKLKEAKTLLAQGVQLAQDISCQDVLIQSLYNLGLVCHYSGDLVEGKTNFLQALHLSRTLNQQLWEWNILNGLSNMCVDMGQFKRGIAYLYSILENNRIHNNDRIIGWTHFNLAINYLPLGEFDLANKHLHQCSHYYRQVGDRRGEGWLLYNTGRLYRQWGQYDRAQGFFIESLQILTDIGDFMGKLFATHNIGLTCIDKGNLNEAHPYLDRTFDIARTTGCIWGEALVYHSRGAIEQRQGRYQTALPLFEEALRLRTALNYPRGISATTANLALVYANLGQHRTALPLAEKAVAIARSIDALPRLAHALTCLGYVLLGLDMPEKAERAYREAIGLRHKLAQPHLLPDPQAGLAIIALKRGDQPEACRWVETILPHFTHNVTLSLSDPADIPLTCLPGSDDPRRVYRVCQTILSAKSYRLKSAIAELSHPG